MRVPDPTLIAKTSQASECGQSTACYHARPVCVAATGLEPYSTAPDLQVLMHRVPSQAALKHRCHLTLGTVLVRNFSYCPSHGAWLMSWLHYSMPGSRELHLPGSGGETPLHGGTWTLTSQVLRPQTSSTPFPGDRATGAPPFRESTAGTVCIGLLGLKSILSLAQVSA